MDNNIFPQSNEPEAKNCPVWKRVDTAFAIITLVLSVFFADWTAFGGFNAGFSASFLLLFILTVVYLYKTKKRLGIFPLLCGIASIGFSITFSLYDDILLRLLFFPTAFFLYGIFVGFVYCENEESTSPIGISLKNLIVKPLNNISKPFVSYSSYKKEKGIKGVNKQIVIGFLLSVPVLSVIIPLLIRSDVAFEGLVSSAFSGFGTILLKIVLGVITAVYLFSLLFALKSGLSTNNRDCSEPSSFKGVPRLTALAFLSVIILVYLVYLFSQFAYFFSGFSGILPKGYSFSASAYARRGFFELCAVCGINFAVICLVLHFVKEKPKDLSPVSVRIASTVICVFSLVFSATALSKMFLYIGFYGLSRLRLLTSIFMVAIVALFIIMIISMFVKGFSAVKCTVLCFAVIGLVMGFCDVDRTVASYNVNAYKKGSLKELDTYHLGTLSDSAVPYIASLIDSKDETVRQAALTVLYERTETLFEIGEKTVKARSDNSFKNYNYSRKRAEEIIIANIKTIMKAQQEREYESTSFPENIMTQAK